MKITVVGTGYVGLVQGVVLADFGLNVICFDSDVEKINKLNNGIIPIYEPGLQEILNKNVLAGRLNFSSNADIAYSYGDVIFIAVGTPPKEDGSADLSHVSQVAKNIGQAISKYTVIVNKSTVPVGTGRMVRTIIAEELKQRDMNIEFDVVSNPEFLREGKAINDCLHPDRVVIGAESQRAELVIKQVYNMLFINKVPFVFTNIETAEMIKYASNAFLAVKISFINEIALLSEQVGADTQQIAHAMGMDGRISSKFLHCGPGYGGSCFPKDTKALVKIGQSHGETMMVVKAAIDANKKQTSRMVSKICNTMGAVDNKMIGVLGLSFKPDTDDTRDAPSIVIIKSLVNLGARIKTYCPQGMKEARWRLSDLSDFIIFCNDEYEAAKDVDALVLVTEWNQFRGLDLIKIKNNMNDTYLFDLRNIFRKSDTIRQLFKYSCVG